MYDLFSSFSETNNQWFVRRYFEIYQRSFDSFWSFCTGNNLICSNHFNHYHFHCKICPSCSRTCPWSVTKRKPVVILKCIWFITLPTCWVKDFVRFTLWLLNIMVRLRSWIPPILEIIWPSCNKHTGSTITTLVHGSFIFVRFRQLKLSSSGG